MFEAIDLSVSLARTPAGTDLRVPEWRELAARLAAARDLRRMRGDANRCRGGSFARFAQPVPGAVNAGYADVNQPGLADGKANAGIVVAATEMAASADRDTQ